MHCHGCTPSCLPATFEAIIEMVSPFAVELLLPSFLNGLAVKALSSPQTIPKQHDPCSFAVKLLVLLATIIDCDFLGPSLQLL